MPNPPTRSPFRCSGVYLSPAKPSSFQAASTRRSHAKVLYAMVADDGLDLHELKVDGRAIKNGFLMPFQLDMLDILVLRAVVTDPTALGASHLGALGVRYRGSNDELLHNWKQNQSSRRIYPRNSRGDLPRLEGVRQPDPGRCGLHSDQVPQ